MSAEKITKLLQYLSKPEYRHVMLPGSPLTTCGELVEFVEVKGGEAKNKAVRDVIAERLRQVSEEGWTPYHDDNEHDDGDLAAAAASYAVNAANNLSPHGPGDNECPEFWSFMPGWWKPKSPREDLVRAGALILAEIEKIDRDEARKAGA
ncbi:hypothetical protein GOZ80_06040 [Agrobacterium vitis]|uniref:hypothetical protein n=1 Tax=Agrobacterium vitis TaxID=373 RepID=UPI0012E8F02C|nr:hypothetical protein [Agrobacterium vitis]MVA91580.1 hypothetical protein [Agrobacterium vitis]MVB00515.1 hypothetical protein [Agrobacterium vitis]